MNIAALWPGRFRSPPAPPLALLIVWIVTAPAALAQPGIGGGVSGDMTTPAPAEQEATQEEVRRWIDTAADQFRQDARRLAADLTDEAAEAPLSPETINEEIDRALDRFGQGLERAIGQTRQDGLQTRNEVREAIQRARDAEFQLFEARLQALREGLEPPVSLETPGDYVGVVREIFVERNSVMAWLSLLGTIAAGVFLGAIAAALIRRAAGRLRKGGRDIGSSLVGSFAAPLNVAIVLASLGVGLQWVWAPLVVKEIAALVIKLLIALVVFWAVWRSISDLTRMIVWASSRTQSTLDDQMAALIRKVLRLFLLVVFVLYVVSEIFEQDIAGVLAGLGIIGLAVSLAAQDSLKNLFGSFTIFADRPFKLGEAVRFGGHFGAIQEIGFRSTKMRTFEGHLITIPNSQIVNEVVENVGARPHIRRWFTIGVTYDTPPEKLDEAVQILRSVLDGHEGSSPDFPPRVHFYEYGAFSLDILVVYYYHPNDWWAYVEFSERFNREVFERFNEAGIDFAFPTQTLHLAGDEKRQLAIRMLGEDLRRQSPGGDRDDQSG